MARNAGFTLLELILVMLIIGILAGMVVINVAGRGNQARVLRAQSDLATYQRGLEAYALEHQDEYPSDLNALEKENENGTSYITQIKNDPWGNPYVYRHPGRKEKYDLYSRGADKQDGTEDDISVWDIE